ncbi:hypothetical protein ACTFIY_002428 [Dictyostelium cf. discoideum]
MSVFNKLLNLNNINKNKGKFIKIYRSFSTTIDKTSSSSSSWKNPQELQQQQQPPINKINSIYRDEVIITEDTNKFHLEKKKYGENEQLNISKKTSDEYIRPELIERAISLPNTSSPLSDPSKRVQYNMLLEAQTLPILGKGKQHLYNFSTESVDPYIFFRQNGFTIPLAVKFIQRMGLSNHPNRILETMKLFEEKSVILNVVLYSCILSGLANCKDIDNSLMVFERMLADGIKPNNHIFNSLFIVHMANGKVEESFQILNSMETTYGLLPDHINYTSLINGLIKNKKPKLAIQLFSEARIKGMQPDSVTLSVMVDACAKNDLVEKAFQYYEEFKYLNLTPTEVTFNSLIYACAKRSDDYYYLKSFELLQDMALHKFKPDIITYSSLMKGAAKRGEVQVFEKIYKELLYNRDDFKQQPDQRVFTYALFGYANNQIISKKTYLNKSGLAINIEKSEKVLQEMKARGIPLTKYPLDEYLKVLAHSCRIYRTREVFDTEYAKHNIKPDIFTYGIIIKMYVDHRRLENALEILHQMKTNGVEGDYYIYLTLMHGTAKVGYAKTCLKIANEMNRLGFPPKMEDLKGILLRFHEYPDIVGAIKRVSIWDDNQQNHFISNE